MEKGLRVYEEAKEHIGDYKKYKWFFTSSGKLVVGGKSSEQNDELLKRLKKSERDFVVMHTSSPGSPFCIILDNIDKTSDKDIDEVAVFTGCFSRAWKLMKKKAGIDIFHLSQLYKTKEMKIGSWGIKGNVKRREVYLELVLAKQDGKLRAVPELTTKKYLLKVKPGRLDKKNMLLKLQIEMHDHYSPKEILSALPAGGIAISRNQNEKFKNN